MTTSHWIRKKDGKSPDISTDVLVVGGGYIGLSTAYWLTELRPDLKITVLDRSFCGAGASGRNAGFLTKGSASFYKSLTQKWGEAKAIDLYRFAEKSLELAHQHILKKTSDLNYVPSSSFTLFQSEQQYVSWQTDGFDPGKFSFHWNDKSRIPNPLKNKFFGAFENSPEYKINPVELLASIKKLLETRKVTIIESSMAFEIKGSGVQTETNTIKAKQVVMALNGYFPQFNAVFKEAFIPRRAQMLAVEIEEGFDCPALHYDPLERVYWRKAQNNVLLIGGKRLLDESGEKGEFEKISPVIQAGLENYISDQLGLKYKVINRWSGIMGFTEHELPLIGQISAPVETFVIGGFSGHGMGLGFASAKDMAELVTGIRKESFFSNFKKAEFSL